MSWRAITETDLLQAISGAELEALRSAALADGQEDPVAPTMADVTEFVRGYIAACNSNTLGPVGTLPTRLINAAIDLLVVQISARVAGTVIDPNGVRQKASSAAIDLLRDVAACKFRIDVPDEATTEVNASPSPKVKGRPRRFTKGSEDGI